MIIINNVSTWYDGQPVISGLDLHIKSGEFVFLQGESGSGKSTLLKLLYREKENYQGNIWLRDKLLRQEPKYVTRRMIGTIFQSFELLDRKTALENVMLAGEVVGRDEKEIRREALLLLEKVGLKGKEERFPHQLSGGEQQRVAIARALLNQPQILLADEPTGNLDPKNAFLIMELLYQISKEEKITMLVVTHSKELVEAFPARVVQMVEGQVRTYESA